MPLPSTEAPTSAPDGPPAHRPEQADSPAREHTSASRLLLARARFLAEASRLLAQTLDYEATLATVARLATPELVPQVTDDRLTAVARDAQHLALLRALGMGSLMVVPMLARGSATRTSCWPGSTGRSRTGSSST